MPPSDASTQLATDRVDGVRDWATRAIMRRIFQQDEPDDYVLATGERQSVREFVVRAFAGVDLDIESQGSGIKEKGIHVRSGRTLVEVDP